MTVLRAGEARARRWRRRPHRRSRTPRRVSPRPTLPVSIAAPSPAITPQPSRPAASGSARGVDLGGLARGDERLLRERADAERGRELGAVGQRHLLGRVERREAVPRAARAGTHRHVPHTARQFRITKSPGATSRHVVADGFDDAGGLVAEEEREVVVDRALAVVQVGVAHAAGLHAHQRLARPGVGHHDRLDGHRRALRARRPPDLARHVHSMPCSCLVELGAERSLSTRRGAHAHGSVVAADVGQDLGVAPTSIAPRSEHVVDLAVRPARRPGAAAHRAPPARRSTAAPAGPRSCSRR